MRLDIVGRSFALTDAIVGHVTGRVRAAFGAAAGQVGVVSVRLSDINGARGGVDKRCRLVVGLRNLRTVVVEAVHADLYAAVDEAAGRAKEAVRRHVKRRRTLGREYA